MIRIKLYEPIVCTVYSVSTPTFVVMGPSGIVQSTPTVVSESSVHTITVRPTRIGRWTIIADDQRYDYNVTSISELEERIGGGNIISAQPYIHGVVPLGELATCYDVAAQPLWYTKSRGSYVSPIIADTTDRTYIWHMDKLRIPHAGWVTGVRIRLVTDLNASTVDMFQFVFFYGTDTAAMSVRGRTENIDKARLLNLADGYAWLQFQKPVYCRGGEWIGLRVRTSSSTANTVRLNCVVPGALVNELLTTTVSADGLTLTGTNWAAAGIVGAGTAEKVYMTNGSGADADVRTVVSATTTDLIVTPAYSGTLTLRYVCVGRGVIAEYNKSGLLRMSTNPSDTGTNAVNTTFTNYPLQSSFPGFFVMTRPVVALTGDSVMGGTGQTGGGTGSLHEHHVATAAYSTTNDIATWVFGYTGIPTTNASRGGSYIHVYLDKVTPSNPLWGYLNQQWASVAEYKPSIVIYNSIHNDCNDLGIYIPTDAQYIAALDLLNHHCFVLGAKLVMSTGTPLAARDAPSRARGQRFRKLTRHWCARNGVLCIDTERLFHVGQVAEDNEDCWHNTTITTVFGRQLYDYGSAASIHPNSSGSDGANAYQTMGKYIADSLMNPVQAQLVSMLWRIQTLPAAALDNSIAGVLDRNSTAILEDTGTTLDAKLNAITDVTDKLDTMLVADDLVYQFTANSLVLTPASSDSASDIYDYFAGQAPLPVNTVEWDGIAVDTLGLTDDMIRNTLQLLELPPLSIDLPSSLKIRFGWPVDADTITAYLKQPGGEYAETTGTVTQVSDFEDDFEYELAYSADDRPTIPASYRYRFEGSHYTAMLTVHFVYPASTVQLAYDEDAF